MTPPPSPTAFVIARNPNAESRLPFLLSVPVAGETPLVLACSAEWPGGKDVFCFALDPWPEDAEILSEVPVEHCWRAGKAVHLVLQRRQRRRSMFVWTASKGRTLIFWRTQRTMGAARPGLKVPAARGLEAPLAIAVDVRERYAWRFKKQAAQCVRRELPAGDYGVFRADRLVAVVERKTAGDLAVAATGGKLAYVLAELEGLPYACLVVESRLSDVLKGTAEHVRPGWLLSVIAALQVAHPRVGWIFAETRDLAEDFAYRWLAAALKAEAERAANLAVAIEPDAEQGIHADGAPPTLRSAPAIREAPATAYDVGRPVQQPLKLRDRTARLDEALALAVRGTVWTSSAYATHFGITQTTAWQDLTALVAAGSLLAEGERRGRRYRRAEQ